MTAERRQEQLSIPEAFERDTRYIMVNDDRVLPETASCAYCDKPVVDNGMCRRHALEYNDQLCGDGRS